VSTYDNAMSSSVVATCNCPETFLPSSIPLPMIRQELLLELIAFRVTFQTR
jgi:hypothetical protein